LCTASAVSEFVSARVSILTSDMRLLLLVSSLLVLKYGADAGKTVEYEIAEQITVEDVDEFDNIDPDISEDDLLKILEEMGYVVPDNITIDDYSGISDLRDLITGDNTEDKTVDYDYKIFGGEAVIGEEIANTEVEILIYPDIDYQDKLVDEEISKTSDEETEAHGNNSNEDEAEIVWIPAAVVQYDYEILDVNDALNNLDDADTELDYQEDEHYKMFVQKAVDSSVKFENIYQEQRIFNIILLSGISLICLIILFGLVSLIISIFTRSNPANPTLPDRNVKLVNTNGIVKSYAKLPVEVKNMLPSNVAYKQLYDV